MNITKEHPMKSYKKLSLLGLFAISMATTSHVKAEGMSINTLSAQEISVHFQQEINEKFAALINNQISFDDAIKALELAAQQENNPSLLEDIAFLQKNRKQIITCLGKIKQLYAKIESYLDQALKAQINNLGLAQWIKILTK